MINQNKASVVMFLDEADQTIQLNDLAYDMPSERTFKDSGAMVAPCTIARTGIMQYRAKECGAMFADRDPESIVRIATLEEDLFCEDSIESYRSAPITVGHPSVDVNINNSKDLQKGNLDGVPLADGSVLAGTIVLNDADTIALVDTGIQQLSSGHTCTLVMADEGDNFDAKKTNIRANHVAIVESGRAGVASIADEGIPEADPEAKLYDQAYVDGLQKKIDTLQAKVDANAVTMKGHDAAIQKATLTDEAIQVLVNKRIAFIDSAALLSEMDVSGMTELDAKRAIVAELHDTNMSDKSDTYIEVRFDVALEDADEESPMTRELRKQADVVIEDAVEEVSEADKARERSIARNSQNK